MVKLISISRHWKFPKTLTKSSEVERRLLCCGCPAGPEVSKQGEQLFLVLLLFLKLPGPLEFVL